MLLRGWLLCCFLVGSCITVRAGDGLSVGISSHAVPLEEYAAKELSRYIHAVSGQLLPVTDQAVRSGFILGRRGHHPVIDELIREGQLQMSAGSPGPQGYLIKKINRDGSDIIVIAANDETGVLYGVYGFLEEHLGIGFYFDGDVLPEKMPVDIFPDVEEIKTPAVAIRGILPWTNFPQSATSYSWEDWKFILDQAAKMRLNFLQIHNYNGQGGHNEMFHNFEIDGKLSRVWMATAKTGHAWGGSPGWDVNKYLFGSSALFDDYDFGADCALHNENADNRQVFRKGVSEFQRVIAYAHSRGIRIGLGLDINLIPDDYSLSPDDPGVIAARVKQIQTDYPDLDYLLCFQSEALSDSAAVEKRRQWRTIFDGFYKGLKKANPAIRLAVAGWGIRAEEVATLPEDVICAPISHYSDGCENGSVYGNREYWGCPWLERDFNSSVYYYPYNMHLSNTIRAWQNRAPNMKGFYALTWRVTDAVAARIWYLSMAPWDNQHRLKDAGTVYREFAERQYGQAAAALVSPIINGNEPFASDWSECRPTPPFSLADEERNVPYLLNILEKDPVKLAQVQVDKAGSQLAIIDSAIMLAGTAEQRTRLAWLKSRIAAERDHILLNMHAADPAYDLTALTGSWVSNFNHRVTDISSLGNVVSVQNRFIQKNYRRLVKERFNAHAILPPENLQLRGTLKGATLSWKTGGLVYNGFDIYRDGRKVNRAPLPGNARFYEDSVSGLHHYRIASVPDGKDSSLFSVALSCYSGNADRLAPQIVMISPPASVLQGQPVWIKARLLDNRTDELLSATLYYRAMGGKEWSVLPMTRRVKAVFTAVIPAAVIPARGIEYYISAGDGDNKTCFPAGAPVRPLSLVREQVARIGAPQVPRLTLENKSLKWLPVRGASYYNIYRSAQEGFAIGPHTYLTYLAADAALYFMDNGKDLRGEPLKGNWYYRVTAVDRLGYESAPSLPVTLRLH